VYEIQLRLKQILTRFRRGAGKHKLLVGQSVDFKNTFTGPGRRLPRCPYSAQNIFGITVLKRPRLRTKSISCALVHRDFHLVAPSVSAAPGNQRGNDQGFNLEQRADKFNLRAIHADGAKCCALASAQSFRNRGAFCGANKVNSTLPERLFEADSAIRTAGITRQQFGNEDFSPSIPRR
jgi:hypothetical protein